MSGIFLGGLCNCQLNKVIVCLYMALDKKGRQKKKSCSCLVVIGRTKDINETNLAQHFTSNFFIQSVYQQTIWLKLFVASRIHRCYVDVWSVAILCIYLLVLKSIIQVQRMQGRKTQTVKS